MADLTQLRRHREQLEHIRYSGTRSVRDSNGQEIQYRSQGEIERAIAAIDSEIAALTRRRHSLIHLQTSKGI